MHLFRPPRLRLDPLEGVAERRVDNGAGARWLVAPHGIDHIEAEKTDGHAPDNDPFSRLARRMPADRSKDTAPEPEHGRWPDIE